MQFVGFLSWWYGAGLARQYKAAVERVAGVADFFSIELLLATLFSPFRQISVGHVRGSLGVQVRAALDKLISRLIGALIRSCMIVIGGISLLVSCLVALVRIIGWLFLPLLPVFCVGFFILGVGGRG